MTGTKISFKQINQETYLDLTAYDIHNESFVADFETFANERADFLSGSSLGLILSDDQKASERFEEILERIQNALNKKNISLRKSESRDFREKSKLKQRIQQVKKEKLSAPVDSNIFFHKSNLRSGQEIRHEGDVVIFGDVNDSAEIVATGDVIVWGRLRGVVHAGAAGNEDASIAALKFDSCQLRIARQLVSLSVDRKKPAKGLLPQIVKIVDNEVRIKDCS